MGCKATAHAGGQPILDPEHVLTHLTHGAIVAGGVGRIRGKVQVLVGEAHQLAHQGGVWRPGDRGPGRQGDASRLTLFN